MPSIPEFVIHQFKHNHLLHTEPYAWVEGHAVSDSEHSAGPAKTKERTSGYWPAPLLALIPGAGEPAYGSAATPRSNLSLWILTVLYVPL